ncbi:hypothetical protein HY485_04645 [Candidatus Woesearchaeota archaeon]|nr:hypothetical protein [Candidatus Woesearchaeota archaeon]
MAKETGIFCEAFGDTPRNQLIEFFLEMRSTDFGLADVARELKMNKATAYNAAKEIIQRKIIVQYRTIGKTQTYKLNKDSILVKGLIKAHNELMKNLVQEEPEIKLPRKLIKCTA